MKKLPAELFFINIFVNHFYALSTLDYSASNQKFVNFSKLSADTLQNSFGNIIYTAAVKIIIYFIFNSSVEEISHKFQSININEVSQS